MTLKKGNCCEREKKNVSVQHSLMSRVCFKLKFLYVKKCNAINTCGGECTLATPRHIFNWKQKIYIKTKKNCSKQRQLKLSSHKAIIIFNSFSFVSGISSFMHVFPLQFFKGSPQNSGQPTNERSEMSKIKKIKFCSAF